MSSNASNVHHDTSSSNGKANSINAGIDSNLTNNSVHRGSLTPSELESIHQTNSFKQALQLQEEDNLELAAKTKSIKQAK